MAFGTFVIPDFSGAFYQNSLLVQAQGQLVLTMYIISQITHFVNDDDPVCWLTQYVLTE